MPNRVLRDWTDSAKLDGISADAERLLVRLLMKADDYGRFHADPRLVRAACFPLLETIRTEQVDRWLDELSTRRLIFRYEVGSRKLLAVVNFRQRMKQSSPKFPEPVGSSRNWLPDDGDFREVPGSSGKFPEPPGHARGDGDGDGDGDGGERETARATPPCDALTPEACAGWDAARYAADLQATRPEYRRVSEGSILQALQTETDPAYRARAYCDWRAADLGSIEADKRPTKTLSAYLRNVRRFAPGPSGGQYDPATDTREVI